MLSMTGFGEGRHVDAVGTARVVASSVNHRGLSVVVRGDLRDLAIEEQIREEVRRRLVRGAVTVQVTWEATVAGTWDRARVGATWNELAAMARELGAPPPTIHDALTVCGKPRDDAAVVACAVRQALDAAVTGLESARAREGLALAEAFGQIVARLRQLVEALRASAAARLPQVQASLSARVAALIGDHVDPATLARDVAVEVQRIDVAEELVRLEAHLDAFDRLMRRSDPIGREIEFLAQEMAREANTCTTKANDPALSALGIEAKVAIDQIKEQAANVL
jgi:uncharacterized protein YicC (UPF0701 family)